MVASSVLCDTSVLKVVDGLTNIMMSLYIIMQAKHFTVLHAGILLVHDHQTTVYKCIQVWRTRYRGSVIKRCRSLTLQTDLIHMYPSWFSSHWCQVLIVTFQVQYFANV